MKNLLLFGTFLMSAVANAHGESRFGPHGGFIRMPGAFHTEVLQVNPNTLRVFLLDLNWRNPTVQNSSLNVSFENRKKSSATCRKRGDEFLCTFAEWVNLNAKGKLIVHATREDQLGAAI